MKNNLLWMIISMMLLTVPSVFGQQQMEKLGRGLIALNKGTNQIYVGWRLCGNDPSDIAFNLYQSVSGGTFTKVNTKPMVITTDTVLSNQNLTVSNAFFVKPVIGGIEQIQSSTFTLAANTPKLQYVYNIPLQNLNDATINTSTAMPGDVDGDGEYELVVMRTGAGGDTARMLLECYKLDGTYLWRFEFGKNINQANEHNAQAYYVVYDFDGDGKAEVCVRGSERSVFQAGSTKERMVGDVLLKDGITLYPLTSSLQRPAAPEYLFMLEGNTGRPLDSIRYQPAMGPAATYNTTWGGNERPYYQWMSVGYLDGKHPSIITQRGIGEGYWFKVYGFDYREGKFTMRKDSFVTQEPIAFGGHSIRIKDIDNDGKDEILFTGAAVDHDMKLIYNQESKGIGHGDGFQILDIDPDRPGLEWFAVQQNTENLVGAYYWDAATGKVLKKFIMNNPTDPGRGDAACIVPGLRGAQMYGGTQGIMDYKENYINKQPFAATGTVYWDADLAKELLQNDNSYSYTAIKKYDPVTGTVPIIFDLKADGILNTTNFHGATCEGDLLGDWREEVVAQTSDKLNLRIYTTTTPSFSRYYTLMHNPAYRTQLTCLGRIGGNYPDFYFGPGMTMMPPSPFIDQDLTWTGTQDSWNNTTVTAWHNGTTEQAFATGKKVLFDDYGVNGTVTNKTVTISENVSPGNITVVSANDYSFAGTGIIGGTGTLTKKGKGSLFISGQHTFTGTITVWDGALFINGKLNGDILVYGGTYGGYRSNGAAGGRVGGSGTLQQNVILGEKAGIIPGDPINTKDTLFIKKNLTMKKLSYIAFDIGATPESLHDMIDVTGNFNVEDTIFFLINKPATLAPGTYKLINYSGSLTGTFSKIQVLGTEGVACSLSNVGNSVCLSVQPSRAASKVTWAGIANNWENTTDKNWLLNTTPEIFVANDSVVFTNAGAAINNINLIGNLPVKHVLVNSSSNYTFSGNGSIFGNTELTKLGTGKLNLYNENSFSGKVSLQQGSIEISRSVLAGEPSPLGNADASGSNFEMSNSQLRFNSPIAMGFDLGINISGTDTLYTLNTVSFSGIIGGSGKLVKTGAGKLCFTKQNTYTGGTYLKEGTITFSDNSNPLGTGLITMAGGRITFADNSYNTEIFSAPIEISSGATVYLDLDSRMNFTSNLTGSGTMNLFTPYVRADLSGNWSVFTGIINVTTDSDGGDFRVNNSYGYPNVSLNLGAKVYAYRNSAAALTIGELTGVSSSVVSNTPITVGGKNTNAKFDGTITGNSSVTKTGTGSWTLTNANTYTGTTIINGGTLILANTTGSATGTGAITVGNSGTLAGNGTTTGTVTVASGGTLSPGTGAIGKLNISNNVSLSSGSTTSMEINKAAGTYDQLNITGNLALGGTLNIANTSTSAFAEGNSYRLFVVTGTISGSFAGIVPSIPGTNLAWDLSALNTTGTISVKASTLQSQVINFDQPADKTYGDPSFTLTATGGASGNPVTFSLISGDAVTLNGNSLTIVKAGTVTIRATQSGNINYSDALPVERTFTVKQASQSVNFASLPAKVYGDAPFQLSATGSNTGNELTWSVTGDAVSLNGTTVIILKSGTVLFAVQQNGSVNYLASAIVTQNMTISKAKLQVSAADTSKLQGQENPVFRLKYSGFVNGDKASDLASAPVATCTAVATSNPGTYPIVLQGGSDSRYEFGLTNGTLTISTGTAVKGLNSSVISVFPNPVRNKLNIQLTNPAKNANVSVETLSGVKILFRKIDQTGRIELDLQDLYTGIYIVRVREGSNLFIYKIVKN